MMSIINTITKFIKHIWRVAKILTPEPLFWAAGIRKTVALAFSLKVWFFLTATWLLVHDYINGANWVAFNTVLIGARLGNQLMYEYKNGNHSSKKKATTPLQEVDKISVEDGI